MHCCYLGTVYIGTNIAYEWATSGPPIATTKLVYNDNYSKNVSIGYIYGSQRIKEV